MRKEINFKKYTHVEIKLASQTEYKPRVELAFQYMNTTESIYNSIIREKSFIKHFKKGANSQGRTVVLSSCPAALRGRPSTPRAGIPSAMLGRDAGPSAFMQFPWSHALCKLRLLIGRMVDKHFFFLKKISTVKVVSWEPEEVRPESRIWKKVIFSDISTPSSHTHKIINLWVGCLNSPAGERNTDTCALCT